MLKKTSKVLLVALMLNSTAFADCGTMTPIKKGATAECDGYLVSPELEQKIRTDLVYKDKMIENLTKIQTIQENIIRIDQEQLKIYEESLKKEQKFTALEKGLYFTLGAVLTGAVAYGTVKALK